MEKLDAEAAKMTENQKPLLAHNNAYVRMLANDMS